MGSERGRVERGSLEGHGRGTVAAEGTGFGEAMGRNKWRAPCGERDTAADPIPLLWRSPDPMGTQPLTPSHCCGADCSIMAVLGDRSGTVGEAIGVGFQKRCMQAVAADERTVGKARAPLLDPMAEQRESHQCRSASLVWLA